MIYPRFLAIYIATLAAQHISGEDTCLEKYNELKTTSKYIAYQEAYVQKQLECVTNPKCNLSGLEKLCEDADAAFYILIVKTTCDGISVVTEVPECYPESCPIDDIMQDFEDEHNSVPDQNCKTDIYLDDGTSNGSETSAPIAPSPISVTPSPTGTSNTTASIAPSPISVTPSPTGIDDGISSASNLSLNTIAVMMFGMLLHSLAGAMM